MRLEPFCTIAIDFASLEIFPTALGTRIVAIIRKGTVSGEIEGTVLPGGGDWMTLGPDGLGRLDVRCTLRLGDDHVHMTAYGIADLSAGVPATARAHVAFAGAALEGTVCVAHLDITRDDVRYEVMRLA